MRQIAFAFVAVCAACTSIPPSTPYPSPPVRGTPGATLCNRLEDAAGSRSTEHLVAGGIVGGLGIATTAVGVAWGPDTSEGASHLAQDRNLIAVTTGLLLGALGANFLARSVAASKLEKKTTEAMAQTDDHDAYLACVAARADWSGDSTEATLALKQSYEQQAERVRQEVRVQMDSALAAAANAESTALTASRTSARVQEQTGSLANATSTLANATAKLAEATTAKKGGERGVTEARDQATDVQRTLGAVDAGAPPDAGGD